MIDARHLREHAPLHLSSVSTGMGGARAWLVPVVLSVALHGAAAGAAVLMATEAPPSPLPGLTVEIVVDLRAQAAAERNAEHPVAADMPAAAESAAAPAATPAPPKPRRKLLPRQEPPTPEPNETLTAAPLGKSAPPPIAPPTEPPVPQFTQSPTTQPEPPSLESAEAALEAAVAPAVTTVEAPFEPAPRPVPEATATDDRKPVALAEASSPPPQVEPTSPPLGAEPVAIGSIPAARDPLRRAAKPPAQRQAVAALAHAARHKAVAPLPPSPPPPSRESTTIGPMRHAKPIPKPSPPAPTRKVISPPATEIATAKDRTENSRPPSADAAKPSAAAADLPSAPAQVASVPRFVPPSYGLGTAGNPSPKYPRRARREGIEGRVVLAVRVSAEGDVNTVTVKRSSGHAILDRAAVRAVRVWRFEPARRGGVAVTGTIDIPITFRLIAEPAD